MSYSSFLRKYPPGVDGGISVQISDIKIYQKWDRALTDYTKFKDPQDEQVLKGFFENKYFFVKAFRINFA